MPSGVVRSTSRRDPTRRQARHHEHVVVREVVSRVGVEQAHAGSSDRKMGRPKVTARSPRCAVGPGSARPDAGGSTLRGVSASDATPVVLVHGWGGSFETTWRASGFTELLADAGRQVIGVDLLGHGDAPKPHDPEAYADLTARIVDALPDGPGRRRRLLAGGDHDAAPGDRPSPSGSAGSSSPASAATCSSATRSAGERSSPASRARPTPDDNVARLFGQYATQPGNDRVALAAVMQAPGRGSVHARRSWRR